MQVDNINEYMSLYSSTNLDLKTCLELKSQCYKWSGIPLYSFPILHASLQSVFLITCALRITYCHYSYISWCVFLNCDLSSSHVLSLRYDWFIWGLAPSTRKNLVWFWNSTQDLTQIPYITQLNLSQIFEVSSISDLSFFENSGPELNMENLLSQI